MIHQDLVCGERITENNTRYVIHGFNSHQQWFLFYLKIRNSTGLLYCALGCIEDHFLLYFKQKGSMDHSKRDRTPKGNALEITVYYQLVQQAK